MLSENLKKLRQQRAIGINELSRLSGVNASYISAIERGVKSNPSIEMIEKIAGALKVSASELIDAKTQGTGLEISRTPIESDLHIPSSEISILQKNPDIRSIARASRNMTREQTEKLRKVAEALFPEAFRTDEP